MPALKPTRFLSSSTAILGQLGLRCRGTHRHQQLLGGGRAGAAAIYPPGLCKAILTGVQEQLQLDRGEVPAPVQQVMVDGTGVFALDEEDEKDFEESDGADDHGKNEESDGADDHGKDEESDGADDHGKYYEPNRRGGRGDAGGPGPRGRLPGPDGSVQLPHHEHPADARLWPEAGGPLLLDEGDALREYQVHDLGASEYWDEISGAALPMDQVRKARAEEVTFMESWKCWQRVSREEAYRCGRRKPKVL